MAFDYERMAFMKLFINYIAHMPTWVYETLLVNHIIDGLKFPGTGASPEENIAFIQLVKSLGCEVDNHGWNGITGQLHDPHFADCISDFANLEEYLNLPNAWNFSSHIGASIKKLPNVSISQGDFDTILLENLSKIRETINHLTGKKTKICGEGIFPYYFDPRTTTPAFINKTLKATGLKDGLDGLVLDICHSQVASKFMEANMVHEEYSLYDYINDLNSSSVKIIHVSGSGSQKELLSQKNINFSKDQLLDPHVSSTVDELDTLRKCLKLCPNVKQVSNEIAYHESFGKNLTVFDYVREALLTWVAINTKSSVEEAERIIRTELSAEFNGSKLEKVFSYLKKI